MPLDLRRALAVRDWTLRAKIVASMLALFTVIAVVTGAVTVLSLQAYLNNQIDRQLLDSAGRITGPGGRMGMDDLRCTNRTDRHGPGDQGLVALFNTGGVGMGTATTGTGGCVDLSDSQLAALDAADLGSTAKTVNLGDDLGEYRAIAAPGSGYIRVLGLPLGPAEKATRNAVSTAIATTAVGLGAVALAGTWLVRRNLRPLDRVAATATAVAALPLDQGKVALAERVPEQYTDTRTEVGKVGSAVNEMLDHISEALTARHQSEQRVRQFVADASHELRTPLASIKGYAELTRRENEPVPGSVGHAIGRIESEATRMSSLVEDLLLLARLDAGRPLEQGAVDLSQVVIDAVSDAHAASPRHGWELDLPDEPVEVVGDPARLHQIVANLLANARTHTPEGTTVRTSVAKEWHQAVLTVRDNGPGVPEALQPNVFQRFARGDSSRNRAAGSTGLGLSIVAAVAGAHGGTVELSSRPGDTSFVVRLPSP